MKQLLLSLFLCGTLSTVSAQQKFMDVLLKPEDGQGTVRVIQDAEITRMVNGKTDEAPVSAVVPGQTTETKTTVDGDDTTVPAANRTLRKMKANGYRIQVYAGGNSRTARQEAQRMAGKVKGYFSDMPTYTHFQSPRWICRVGDFRTYEEANQALHELKATKQFDEALIVKSVIQIPY
ncbi:MAG: SPOR domain-containing protein [Paraprevotella sp.]|nr:SPOR domain-containing protein [Paraprevotella sp.]